MIKVAKLIDGVEEGFDDIHEKNNEIEKQAIDSINADTNEKIDEEVASANKKAKSLLVHEANRGKINITKLNEIREEGGENIKDTSEQNSDKVAEVSKDAAIVEIVNKAAESKLKKDLVKATIFGESTDKVIATADAPVILDPSDIATVVPPKAPYGNFDNFGQKAF